MLFRKIIIASLILLLIGLGTFAYAPVRLFYEAQERCERADGLTHLLVEGNAELRAQSKRMAILVDLNRLSHASLPADAEIKAHDYVKLHRDLNELLLSVLLNGPIKVDAVVDVGKEEERIVDACVKYISLIETCYHWGKRYSAALKCDNDHKLVKAVDALDATTTHTLPIYKGAVQIIRQ